MILGVYIWSPCYQFEAEVEETQNDIDDNDDETSSDNYMSLPSDSSDAPIRRSTRISRPPERFDPAAYDKLRLAHFEGGAC